MAGLLRNIIAFIKGLLAFGRRAPGDTTSARFLVTPFDAGLRVMKSDKYLTLVEPALLQHFLQAGLFFSVVRTGAKFVNVGMVVKFLRPVPVFSVVRVESRVVYADEKCAFFASTLHVRGERAAEVLVKMKYKKRGVTVDPRRLLRMRFDEVPVGVRKWDEALGGM